ncbi:rolling circle replication-associated protein, partial [Paralimibaculum aggregatum]|uniref:rolling circle replication-associated protein n=1 Tax=Paralimibaculum aggregatum TaxID=3036245 RepID=UPI002557B4F0
LAPWPYVVVAERQKRGAIHFHLAVRGRQDVALLRAAWLAVLAASPAVAELSGLGSSLGNIDVQGSRRRPLHRVARYLAKYLAKDDDREPGERRFRRSVGIVIPEETAEIAVERDAEVVEVVRQALAEIGAALAMLAVDE